MAEKYKIVLTEKEYGKYGTKLHFIGDDWKVIADVSKKVADQISLGEECEIELSGEIS